MTAVLAEMHGGTAERSGRLFSVLRRDFSRYYPPGQRLSVVGKLRVFLDTPAMQAVLVYRFGSWLHRRIRIRIIRLPLAFVHYVLDKLCIICWGIAIDTRANIGPGLYIGHFGGVIVGPVTMGWSVGTASERSSICCARATTANG